MVSEMMPPSIGPAIGADQGRHRPDAHGLRPRFSGGKMRSSSVCDIGIIGPPERPCRTRKPTSMPSEGARPHSSEQRPKPDMQATNTRWRAEPLGQPAGQRHGDRLGHRIGGDHPGALAGRDGQAAGDVGTETLAMVVSSTTMKLARPMQDGRPRTAWPPRQRRRSGAGAAWLTSVMVVAPWRSGRLACETSIVGVHRQADAQRMLRPAPCGSSAMRTGQALHHLDPVAGGVLGRDQGEGRAGAAGQADDLAVVTSRRRRRGRW